MFEMYHNDVDDGIDHDVSYEGLECILDNLLLDYDKEATITAKEYVHRIYQFLISTHDSDWHRWYDGIDPDGPCIIWSPVTDWAKKKFAELEQLKVDVVDRNNIDREINKTFGCDVELMFGVKYPEKDPILIFTLRNPAPDDIDD